MSYYLFSFTVYLYFATYILTARRVSFDLRWKCFVFLNGNHALLLIVFLLMMIQKYEKLTEN